MQNDTVYRSDLLQCRKLNIFNRLQAVWREAHGQDPCSCLKKSVDYHNWFALPERPVSDAHAPFVLPEYLKMALSKSVMRNVARFRIRGHGLKCEMVYMAGVRTGVHVFAICVKTGIYSR